jgi:phosphopantothenoylcysteine decarboxylase/phosphopantothenate--cysteine ligase
VKVLVSAGPTWEFIDAVRYIASPSSGRMGFAVAEAFAAAAHEVTLVCGPTQLQPPPEVKCVRVTSARQMQQAMMEHLEEADAVVMTAAVSDYRPAQASASKKKRSGDKWVLELVENPDILKGIGQEKGERVLVGFAVESDDPRRNALGKLRRKNLDLIVLNGPAAFGADRTSVEIIDRDERVTVLENVSKRDVAETILARVTELVASRKH